MQSSTCLDAMEEGKTEGRVPRPGPRAGVRVRACDDAALLVKLMGL